jgi:hypothetical protein
MTRQRGGKRASKPQVTAAREGSNRTGKRSVPSKLMGTPMAIARVVRSAAVELSVDAVVVEIGRARISVHSGFDSSLLQQVVRALQGAA